MMEPYFSTLDTSFSQLAIIQNRVTNDETQNTKLLLLMRVLSAVDEGIKVGNISPSIGMGTSNIARDVDRNTRDIAHLKQEVVMIEKQVEDLTTLTTNMNNSINDLIINENAIALDMRNLVNIVDDIGKKEEEVVDKINYNDTIDSAINAIEAAREGADAASGFLGSLPIVGGFLAGGAKLISDYGASAAKAVMLAKKYKVGQIANLAKMIFYEKAESVRAYEKATNTLLTSTQLKPIMANATMELINLRNQIEAVSKLDKEGVEPTAYVFWRPLNALGSYAKRYHELFMEFPDSLADKFCLFPVHGLIIMYWPFNDIKPGSPSKRLGIRVSVEDFKQEESFNDLMSMFIDGARTSLLNYEIVIDHYEGDKWVTKYSRMYSTSNIDWRSPGLNRGPVFSFSDMNNGTIKRTFPIYVSWRQVLCGLELASKFDVRKYNVLKFNCQHRVAEIENLVKKFIKPKWWNSYVDKEYLKCTGMPVVLKAIDGSAPITIYPHGMNPSELNLYMPSVLYTKLTTQGFIATAQNMDGTITILDNNGNQLVPSDQFKDPTSVTKIAVA